MTYIDTLLEEWGLSFLEIKYPKDEEVDRRDEEVMKKVHQRFQYSLFPELLEIQEKRATNDPDNSMFGQAEIDKLSLKTCADKYVEAGTHEADDYLQAARSGGASKKLMGFLIDDGIKHGYRLRYHLK